ncbi:AP-5 complex subunit mu-like [Carica papaya]|uniref:AP-5 complex subunit mu-like n=1 Tax=Carica papaya TaxID=3649 RepID=UPI000B8D0843|nr:AP-5 complex subunit mu-like [Carica papaya]XP_021904898.1 AP-5 complex subunit mu-like [Carica papaya]
MTGCGVRALWILNSVDAIVFSRRFTVVEKRWRAACQSENESASEYSSKNSAVSVLPTDPELATAFAERKQRWKFVFTHP